MNWRRRELGARVILTAALTVTIPASGAMHAQPAAPAAPASAGNARAKADAKPKAEAKPGYILPADPVQELFRRDKNLASLEQLGPDGDHFFVPHFRGAQLAEADGPADAAARHAGAVSRGQSRVAAVHLRQRRPEDLLVEGPPLRRRDAAGRHVRQRFPLVAGRRAPGVPGAPAGGDAGVDRRCPHGQGGSGWRRGRDGDARAARRRRQSQRALARQRDAAVAARRIAADAARAGQIAGRSPPTRRCRRDRQCGGRATRRRRPRRSRSC